MGLLTVLDHHYKKSKDKVREIEYRLISWGEIYPPFLGNREHSVAARFILDQFPFKLFSVTTPYSELPQKLCLTFRAPLQTHETDHVSSAGFLPDEIAKEFAAFLSIVTRRRVFAVGQTRADELPIEETADFYQSLHFQEKQRLKEIQPSEINRLLNLQAMDRRLARSFVLAMRLYHSAVEMMFTEPEFSYLFLVMSIEAISSVAYENLRPSDEGDGRTELDQFLSSTYPGWQKLCDTSTPELRTQVIKMLLTKAYFTRRKFREFICANVPDAFWNETEDDAKPDYLQGAIVAGPDGFGREQFSRADMAIRDLERIQPENLKQTLDKIYQARSELVHQGIPLPPNIVVGHFRMIPWRVVDSMMEVAASGQLNPTVIFPIPPLIAFERLVSYCMVEFLSRQIPQRQPDGTNP